MQYLVTLFFYGALCITIGYISAIARARQLNKATMKLLHELDQTQAHLDEVHAEILRMTGEETEE